MKQKILISSIAAMAMALVGCGGGSSSVSTNEVTKVIFDDPIAGLNYQCGTQEEMKVTNAKGEFTCNEGERVSFYLGKYALGSASVSEGSVDTLRIADLGLSPEAVTDVRQVLQTLDSDEDGVIEIPEDFDALDEVTVAPGAENFDETMEEALGESLVSEEEADAHANAAYLTHLLANQTFYIYDREIATLSFSEKEILWEALFSTEKDEPTPYTIENNEIVTTDEGEEVRLTLEAEDANSLTFVAGEERMVLYKTLEAFQSYLATLVPEDGIKIDKSDDSQNSNVIDDGFELTSLKTTIEEENIVIEVHAKGSIIDALKTTPRDGFSNILWISISNDYEYGLGANGDYLTKDHWINGEFHEGTQVDNYTSELLADGGVKVTLPLSELSDEIRAFGYLNITAEIADDHNDDAGTDESRDEEHSFDLIETMLSFLATSEETPLPVETSSTIVGSWYVNDEDGKVVVTFFENGSYMVAEVGEADEDGQSGIERGTYTYNSTEGTLVANPQTDTNGEWGLSHPGDGSMGIELSENQLVFIEGDERYISTRVPSEANAIVGSWFMGDASQDDNSVMLTFFSNGEYLMGQDGVTPDGDCSEEACHDGVEFGSYTIDENGNLSVDVTVDTNGEWGFSHASGISIEVNGDTLIMHEGEESYTAQRVE
jgi:hypothetical protein